MEQRNELGHYPAVFAKQALSNNPIFFRFLLLGLAAASGLSATMLLTHLVKSGEHIVCMDDVYGGT